MDKKDKAHGTLVSKAYYIEDLVSSHFGFRGDPEFHHPLFEGIVAVGVSSNKVFIYVKDENTEKQVLKELQSGFEQEERDWVAVKITGEITPL